MVDTLPVSPQPVIPEQPRVIPPSASIAPVSSPQAIPSVVSKGSDLAERSDPLSMEYAGFGARFLASALDSLIVGAIVGLVMIIPGVILVKVAAGASGASRQEAILFGVGLIFQVISWVSVIGYYIYFTGKYGQTLGKKALKIRVVRAESGEAPGYTKAFLREVVGKMVSAMAFGLGYLWILWDGKKQTWHDKIAGTVVVKA